MRRTSQPDERGNAADVACLLDLGFLVEGRAIRSEGGFDAGGERDLRWEVIVLGNGVVGSHQGYIC